MRNLYLHIGIHKTGSSFLQFLLAGNRSYLAEKGFHFPKARKRDENMLLGKISAGNGRELTNLLLKNNLKGSLAFLEAAFKETESLACSSLLISDERLARALALPSSIDNWKVISKKLHINHIRILIFMRDPLDHLISLYKHRAKNGDHENFDKWLIANYETMKMLNSLISLLGRYPFEWTFRKYQRDSNFLAVSLFEDWLNIRTPTLPQKDTVNTSLTFSELKLIQSLKGSLPYAIPFIRQSLSELPNNKKRKDTPISHFFEKQGATFLNQYVNLIETINKQLPEDEQLVLSPPPETIIPEKEPIDKSQYISLSIHQIEAFSLGLQNYSRSNQLLIHLKSKLRSLRRLIRSKI